MKRVLSLVCLLALAACDQAQICRQQATRDLVNFDKSIAEQQQIVDQGYTFVAVPGFWGMCFAANAGPRPHGGGGHPPGGGHHHGPHPQTAFFGYCDNDPFYKKVAVNVAAERAKLNSLKAQRPQVAAQAQARLANCPAK